jgi:hypothetical protein
MPGVNHRTWEIGRYRKALELRTAANGATTEEMSGTVRSASTG